MSQKLALIIANGEYEDRTLAQLVTPDADANALAQILRDPEIGGFDEVTALVNQPSTVIRRAISSFFVGRGRDDLLLLYFSGHGIQDDRGQLFLAVKDTEHNLLRGTAIPAAFVTEEMDNSRSHRQVLILDCCHSGSFSRGMKGAPGISVGTAAAFEGTGFGRVVLTATDSTQYAWEGDRVVGRADNSVFTQHLINGLRSGMADTNGDGQITLDELYDYVYEQVVNETPKQTPSKWSYGQQGEIVIATNLHPVVKPAELPPDLQQTLDDSRPWVREGAVRELDRLMHGSNPGLTVSAREALKRLANDDSRRVASLAAESLAVYSGMQPSTADTGALPVIHDTHSERREEELLSSEKIEAKHAEQLQPMVATHHNILATILKGPVWKQILLIATGWAISGLIGGYISWNNGGFISLVIGGAVGGLITGLVMRPKKPSIYWKQVLLIAAGWAGGLIIDGVIGNSISQVIGNSFADAFYNTLGISWDNTFIFGIAIGGALGGAVGGTIGGLATGLVLQQTKPSIRRKQILVSTISWALVWAICAGVFWAINQIYDWTSAGLVIIGLAISQAVGAAIGSAIMFSQFGQADPDTFPVDGQQVGQM